MAVNSFISNFPTLSGQTIQGLVDGWHNPIAFSRWPVNSTVLNPPNGQPLPKDNDDSDDPSGLLASSTWQSSPGYAQYLQYGHAVGASSPQAGTDATSFRVFPLIASSGPDGQLGLNPITFQTTNAAQATDNLYPTLAPPSQ